MHWFSRSLFRKLLLITGGGTTLLLASALTGLWWIHVDITRMDAGMHHEVTVNASPASRAGTQTGQAQALAQRVRSLTTRMDQMVAQIDQRLVVTLMLMAASVFVSFVFFMVLSRRGIVAPARTLVDDLERLAGGDFSAPVHVGGQDEFGVVARAAERLRTGIGELIGALAVSAEELGAQAAQLRTTAGHAQEAISGQRVQTDQIATAMNEMAASVQEVARNTQTAAQTAQQGKALASSGALVASEAMGAIEALIDKLRAGGAVMDQLRAAATEIGGVLEIIAGLAEQTNLLALNAAIEAARAGEHGRGFAVVADEVRSLSQKTHQSTERIREAVEHIQRGAGEAVASAREADAAANKSEEQVEHNAEALAEISGAVGTIADLAAQIASAAEEQSTVAAEIDRNVVAIAEGGRDSEVAADEVRTYSERLQALAADLTNQTARFRLG